MARHALRNVTQDSSLHYGHHSRLLCEVRICCQGRRTVTHRESGADKDAVEAPEPPHFISQVDKYVVCWLACSTLMHAVHRDFEVCHQAHFRLVWPSRTGPHDPGEPAGRVEMFPEESLLSRKVRNVGRPPSHFNYISSLICQLLNPLLCA